jgi:hypothetical protein
LLLESGALIVAIALVLWRIGAPGATGRLVTGSLVAAALYAAVRLGAGAPAGAATYTETGLGFADVSAAQLGETFTHAPWMLWLYNYIASLLTVLVSEPRAGRYLFIESLLHGNTPAWMYVHVLTSVVTTGAIAYMLASGRVVHDRDRQIAAAGLTILILGSVLGFLYTRDRIALSAGVGYAMLVYVAVAAMWEEGRKWPSITALCIGVIAVGWATRAGEAYFQLRDAAWENYLEWTLRYEELGGHTRPQTDVLTTLRRDATARVPDDPRRDAAWTYAVFERQYQRTATR